MNSFIIGWSLVCFTLLSPHPSTVNSAPAENPQQLTDAFEQLFQPAEDSVDRIARAAPNLYVNVQIATQPETVELNPGESIEIRCSAQADLTTDDYLYVSFFRQFGEYTHMPLSSGDPGISVEPTIPLQADVNDFQVSNNPEVVNIVKVLTLGPDAYDALDNGHNLFYCKGATRSGERAVSYFIVKRIHRPPLRPRHHPRYRRWTLPPRV